VVKTLLPARTAAKVAPSYHYHPLPYYITLLLPYRRGSCYLTVTSTAIHLPNLAKVPLFILPTTYLLLTTHLTITLGRQGEVEVLLP
jgi:hypothetical protein